MIALYVILCAILNRWRGSGHWPLNVKRAIISAVLTAPVAISLPWHGLVLFLSLWVFGFGMGWGAYFDFGTSTQTREVRWIDWVRARVAGNEERKDLVAMSLRGLHFTVPAALILAYSHPIALVYAPLGLLMGPVYYGFSKQGGDYIGPSELAWGAILGGIFIELGMI